MTDADQALAQQAAEELTNGRQPLWTQFRLGWRRTYYNMAQALGLKRLQDLLQVLRHPVRLLPRWCKGACDTPEWCVLRAAGRHEQLVCDPSAVDPGP